MIKIKKKKIKEYETQNIVQIVKEQHQELNWILVEFSFFLF